MSGHLGPRHWSVRLADTDSALGCAQREVRRVVNAWGLGQVADVVELLALELVSAAMGIGRQKVTGVRYRDLVLVRSLWLRFQLEARGLVVATWDYDPRPPRMRRVGAGSSGGELYWVPMLAEAWNYFRSGSGKVVWFEMQMPLAGERRLPRRRRCQSNQRRMSTVTDLALLERVREGLRLPYADSRTRGQP